MKSNQNLLLKEERSAKLSTVANRLEHDIKKLGSRRFSAGDYIYDSFYGYGVVTKATLDYSNCVCYKPFNEDIHVTSPYPEHLARAYFIPWAFGTVPKGQFDCIIDRCSYVCHVKEVIKYCVYGVFIEEYTCFASFEYLANKATLPNGAPCGLLLH